MYARVSKSVSRVLALAFVALIPIALSAQVTATSTGRAFVDDFSSKWDIFAGYSYLAPINATVNGYRYNPVNYGTIVSISRYFNNYIGIQGEGDVHLLTPESLFRSSSQPGNDFSGGSAGLIFHIHTNYFTPFVHVLAGAEKVGSYSQTDTWGAVGTAGIGVDYNTPWFNHHLAIRLIQADYQYIRVNFPGYAGVTSTFNVDRLSAGVVFHFSSFTLRSPVFMKPVANPSSISPDVSVTPSEPASEQLSPTISCMAKPRFIMPGDSSIVTAVGISPQNRSLTYSYMASAGTVSGNGATATFSSMGVRAGSVPVTITCNVSDDKGQTASASTYVTISEPHAPPISHTKALCSITFSRDKKRPTRVDNEAAACMDEVALALQQQPDAKAVVVGEATNVEKAQKRDKYARPVENVAGERAVNAKDYLVTEKGIDASRINVATSFEDRQVVENYLVPSGASFASDVTGTTPVNEAAIKAQSRKPVRKMHAPIP